MNNLKLVGLIGSAGAGKDTFAEELAFSGYHHYAFADSVRDATAGAFGIDPSYFSDRKLKEDEEPYWEVSPRQMLQFVGTELFRENAAKLVPKVGKDFWIHALKYKLYLLAQEYQCKGVEAKVVITDCRFQNEVEFILAAGGKIIYLTRPGFDGNVGIQSHPSELFVKEFPKHYPESPNVIYVQNNGSLIDLKIKVNVVCSYL